MDKEQDQLGSEGTASLHCRMLFQTPSAREVGKKTLSWRGWSAVLPCEISYVGWFYLRCSCFPAGKAGMEECSLCFPQECGLGHGKVHTCWWAGTPPAPFTYIRRSIATKEAVFWLIPHSVPWSAPKCHREDWPRQGEVTTTKGQRQGRRSELHGICLSAAHQGPGPSVLPTLFVFHSQKKYRAGGWRESRDLEQQWCEQGSSGSSSCKPAGKALSAEEKATFNKGNYYNYIAMVLRSYMWYEFHSERLQSAAGLL